MPLVKSINPAALNAFSLRDVEAQAREIIEKAGREAESIRERAKEQGVELGRCAGFEEGMKQGREQAIEEHRENLAQAIESLKAAMTEINGSREQLEAEGVREMVELAIAIARRITKRIGETDQQALIENVSAVMKATARPNVVRIVIHPRQVDVLKSALPALQMEWPGLRHAQIAGEESVACGGCRIVTEHGEIDADLQAQLDRVVEEILPAR